jgi:hypothetical protein
MCIRKAQAHIVSIVMKRLLHILLAASLLTLGGCANRRNAGADEDVVHGSAGVRFQSQDTSRLVPGRTPL